MLSLSKHYYETYLTDYYVVQGIPAKVCTSCGEPVFAIEVGEQIRKILNEEIAAPHTTIALEQYDFV
jgi:YgiT-type zinc finger domain-containing protein